MAGEWIETTIGDIADVYGGSTPSTKDPENFDGEVPWLTPKDLSVPHPRYVRGGERNLSQKGLRSCSAQLLPTNTVLLSSRAPIGYVAIAANPIATNQGFRSLVVKPEHDHEFLYYWLAANVEELERHASGSTFKEISGTSLKKIRVRIPARRDEQRAIAHILGTLDDKIELNRRMSETLEAMARALFKSWFVDFLPVRAKMAAKAKDPSLLLPQAEPGTWYVYAIECNDGSLYIGQTEDLRQRWLQHVGGKGADWTRSHPPLRVPYWEKQPSREAAVERENWLKTGYGRKWLKKEIAARLLARSAQASTQTGDPVRAKAEGRDPLPASAGQAGGLPKPLADLFPARLVESELGEIPEGWEVGTLGELVETVKGRSYKSEELADSDTALVTLKSFARGGGYRPDGLKPFVGTYKPEQVVMPGEVVIACTDVTQAAEVIGRPAIVRGTSGYRRLVASLDTLIVRPRDSRISRAFLYFLGGTDAFVTHTYAHTIGTTVLHLAKEAVPSFRFARPFRPLVQRFDAVAVPALDRIQALDEEAGTLAALRDALLPKLISGELRVKDAERFLKERGIC